MTFFRSIALSIAIAALAGCAAPPLPAARVRNSTDSHGLAVADSVKQTSNTIQHLNAEKTIVYTQNFGGGGVGLGLLLGPIGAAANASMIETVTKDEAAKLFGKFRIEPAQVFLDAAATEHMTLQSSGIPAVVQITPYLLFVKVNESTINLAAALHLESPGKDSKLWTAKYIYQLSNSHTLEAMALLDETQQSGIKAELLDGYRKLITLYLRDIPELIDREQKVVFKSTFVTPRFEFEMPGSLVEESDSTIWLRTYSGVYALKKSSVTYTIQK